MMKTFFLIAVLSRGFHTPYIVIDHDMRLAFKCLTPEIIRAEELLDNLIYEIPELLCPTSDKDIDDGLACNNAGVALMNTIWIWEYGHPGPG